jgi:integrase
MRTVKFEPKEIPGRKLPWMVNFPASVSPSGKRERRFFATERQARGAIANLQHEKKYFGSLIDQISQHDLSEAVRAVKLLEPTGIGLLRAVESFLSDHNKRAKSKTLLEVFDARESNNDWSESYAESIRHTKSQVYHLLDQKIVDITPEDLDGAFKGCAVTTRDLRINRMRDTFGYAIQKGWAEINPADRLDRSKSKSAIKIFQVSDVEKLLRSALVSDPEFVPYLSVCFFCGIRPESEAFDLEWKDIHLDDDKPELVVQADLSKTRDKRAVDISVNCIEWINASGVNRTGKVFPFSQSTLNRKREVLCKLAKVKWIKDGPRHTYASAHITKHQSIDRLLLQIGHKGNPRTLWKHYYRTMSATDAKRGSPLFSVDNLAG